MDTWNYKNYQKGVNGFKKLNEEDRREKRIIFKCTKNQHRLIKAVANKTNTSMSEMIRESLYLYLKEKEMLNLTEQDFLNDDQLDIFR